MTSITVGGLPGTGTSTLCRRLRDRLGLPYVYAGQLFRDEAASRGLGLAEFGRLCQEDASVDQALDAKQAKLLQGDALILEGRLSGWLAHRDGARALKVWLHCDMDERVRRVVERDGGDGDAQKAAMLEREASEADRYNRYYGANLSDHSIYDLVLDSTQKKPDDLVSEVITAFRSLTAPRKVA